MRVSLFVSCLVDQLWPSVGLAAADVLRRAGCEVDFNDEQTCCGQPAFNTGYRDEARRVAQHMIETYEGDTADAIVMPSGSCAAMVHHLRELFEDDEAWRARAEALAQRTFELGSFLVRELDVEDVGARFDGRVTWHDACHGLRDLGIRDEPRRLIANVSGAELVDVHSSESCCGFGGTFSVKYPEVSVAMLDQKLQAVEQADVQAIVSGDVSCLMQIGGRLQRRKSAVRTIHLAELLASRG
ncbi:MAG: (Fe-S)-binding protein [bacterium]|nr:(Fe-S)-binding protein [bacterium]